MINILKIARSGMRYCSDKSYRVIINTAFGLYNNLPDEEFLKKYYRAVFHRELNLNDPKTFNEKLQWLKLYNRKPEYTVMVDKYKVRKYVADTIGEQYLIPLLGVWDDPEDIDFDALPEQFVLKCNHNSGLGMCICKDKSKLDIPKVKRDLKKGLEQDYFLTRREWPYKDVPRRIIAEKYMSDGFTEELKDYKFYCFNGVMQFVMINSDRNTAKPTKADYFDRDFNWLDFIWGYPHADTRPSKPNKYDEMIAVAEKLSNGLPHVRVDLYECNNQIYFGELTFFDGSGFDKIQPIEWDYKIGSMIQLPEKHSI